MRRRLENWPDREDSQLIAFDSLYTELSFSPKLVYLNGIVHVYQVTSNAITIGMHIHNITLFCTAVEA